MAKIKVHEYAKQIGKPTKELVSLLNENGISVKSHLSNIDDTGIAFLNKHFNVNITSAGDVKNEPKTETKEKNENLPQKRQFEVTRLSSGLRLIGGSVRSGPFGRLLARAFATTYSPQWFRRVVTR